MAFKQRRSQESADLFSALSDAFGKKGIQHFQLDSAVRDLGTFAAHFLEHLSSSFQLTLEMQQVCLAVLALYQRHLLHLSSNCLQKLAPALSCAPCHAAAVASNFDVNSRQLMH